ncbi:PQQ-dependent sugar dehydrogenase [Demequina aurantiaca]|uniref:PQQ-dependent sugar dehydrogenase n=1 Tax=Demequina aurantiaca TaxID=676200 RepID=UPI0007806548|nr:PQQ-dependent sugar dehydrogenase [Demequina aurantiaca]
MTIRRSVFAAATFTALIAVTGCSSADPDVSSSATASQPSTTSQPSISASGSLEPIPVPSIVVDGAATATVTSQTKVVSSLAAPWDLEPMPDGSMLVSERDTGAIKRIRAGFATSLNGPGAEALRNTVVAEGEGGLLGLAVDPSHPSHMYAYLSRADGNAVVRMTLTGELLSAPVDVVTGIPHAANHDGGRIDFGPDGYLYIATGDAADGDLAQDKDSLAGKILRVVADGSDDDGTAPTDNPFDSLVWSMGHRNVEGFAWTADGRMYASEFGQNTTDELNLIEPGANYGWPDVEAREGAPAATELSDTVDGLTYPVAEWPVADASPSGVAITEDAIYVAALRGEDVWRIPLTQDGIGTPARLDLDLGRIRAVALGPEGSIYILTNNTDGRGEPRDEDDHVFRLDIS